MIDLVFFHDFKRLEQHARENKLEAVIIAKPFKSLQELEELRKKSSDFSDIFKFCHLLEKTEPKQLNRFKGKADLVAVLGKDVSRNKFAVSTKGISLLLAPCSGQKIEFDTAIARLSAQNLVPIAVLFSDFLNAGQFEKSMLFKNHFLALKLCKKMECNLLFFSGARNPAELRAPRNLQAFAELLGLKRGEAQQSIAGAEKALFGKAPQGIIIE